MSRQAALDRSATYFDSGRFEQDLSRLVAIPSESQHPHGRPFLQTYLEEGILPILTDLGFQSEILPNPDPSAGPFLLAERIENPNLPTVLSYGHGDVVRGQADQWAAGLSPFELRKQDDRYYGRGTADSKGQHLINCQALASVIHSQGALGFNLKILIETGEEIGSPGLKELCETHKDKLAADVFIASDGPRVAPDTPTVFTGSRGGINFDLCVNLRESAHHSGNFGGLLKDPAVILAHALASITDARGQLNIPEWRPTSLTEDVRATLAALPPVDAGFALDEDWGEQDLTLAERVFGWNSFTVLAMTSGVPDAPVNAISGQARAHCQLRFVVGTDLDDIVPALRRHLDRNGFSEVEVNQAQGTPFPATRLALDHPWLRFVTASLESTCATAPDVLPNLGGSLPNDCFSDVLGLPTLWIPHSYAGSCQHAPNEHLPLSIARQGLMCMTGLFADIAATGGPQ